MYEILVSPFRSYSALHLVPPPPAHRRCFHQGDLGSAREKKINTKYETSSLSWVGAYPFDDLRPPRTEGAEAAGVRRYQRQRNAWRDVESKEHPRRRLVLMALLMCSVRRPPVIDHFKCRPTAESLLRQTPEPNRRFDICRLRPQKPLYFEGGGHFKGNSRNTQSASLSVTPNSKTLHLELKVTILQARGNHSLTGGSKSILPGTWLSSQQVILSLLRCMWMQAHGLWCIKVRQVAAVIAITLTPVRHKRHMQFLTAASNFRGRGASWLPGPPDPAFQSHCTSVDA